MKFKLFFGLAAIMAPVAAGAVTPKSFEETVKALDSIMVRENAHRKCSASYCLRRMFITDGSAEDLNKISQRSLDAVVSAILNERPFSLFQVLHEAGPLFRPFFERNRQEAIVKLEGDLKTASGDERREIEKVYMLTKNLSIDKMCASPVIALAAYKELLGESGGFVNALMGFPLYQADEGMLSSLSRPKLAALAVVALAGYTVAYEWLFKPWGAKLQQWIAAKRGQKVDEKAEAESRVA